MIGALIGFALATFMGTLAIGAFSAAVHQARADYRLALAQDHAAGYHGFGAMMWAVLSGLLWTVAYIVLRFS